MTFLGSALLLLALAGVVQPTSDPYCSCQLDQQGLPVSWESTQIWLDVVIILDTSEAMGAHSLAEATALLQSFFVANGADVLTTSTNENFYSRIGLIVMSDTPQVLFNMNMTKADNIMGKIQMKKGLSQIDVAAAFDAAEQMLKDGRSNNVERQTSRQVIYYMTNSDHVTITEGMSKFKDTGVIIVNNFVQNGEELFGLIMLASEGYYFSDIQNNTMASIQSFCKANCYCLPDKTAYEGYNEDRALFASGGCLRASDSAASFSSAQKTCAEGKGLLVSVHDQDKAEAVHDLMTSTNYYWIGYSKTEKGWTWEDQSTNSYEHWNLDEPNPSSVAACTYVDGSTTGLYWGAGNCNIAFNFVCEYAPCAVGDRTCTLKTA